MRYFASQEQLSSVNNSFTDVNDELNKAREAVTRLDQLCNEKNEEHNRIVNDFENAKRFLEVRSSVHNHSS